MKLTTAFVVAVSAMSIAACAANPPPTHVQGPAAGPAYGDGRYDNNRYGDRYGERRYDDGRYDDRRYNAGERYYDERARRYYTYDPRTGYTYWENGELRSR
ncbi:hypothetical protein [Henriciella sp.]|uniref:hypothetical protein n=1 Tax=Henriciella sp. TaxID=1968823 RepID=UPI00262939C3|nr:hypothetical protein [Henriciella sp.]